LFSIPLFIFAVIVFIITAVLLNLEKIVEKVSSRFINGRVVIEDIDLSFSKPVVKNITLYDDKNNVLFNSPEVTANISFKNLTKGRIDELNVNSAIVNVVRDKDGVINFTKLSKTKSEEKPKNPLNKVVVSNVRVNYEDYTFPTKLERKVENINAIVTASKEKLVETADINIKDEKDWSFNPDNMVLGGKADARYIDYSNLKYFDDESSMKEHLRKLNEAAKSVK